MCKFLSMNVYNIQVPITKFYLIQLIEKSLTTYLKIGTYVLSNLLMLIWSNLLWYKNVGFGEPKRYVISYIDM
jgi:hypothetical protein